MIRGNFSKEEQKDALRWTSEGLLVSAVLILLKNKMWGLAALTGGARLLYQLSQSKPKDDIDPYARKSARERWDRISNRFTPDEYSGENDVREDVPPQTDAELAPDFSQAAGSDAISPHEPCGEAILLDNTAWVKLVDECAQMMDEMQGLQKRLEGEGNQVAEHAFWRLQEILERCGVDRIEGEESYDIRRHEPVPVREAPLGTAVDDTIVPGLCIGNRVFRRAKVRLAEAEAGM